MKTHEDDTMENGTGTNNGETPHGRCKRCRNNGERINTPGCLAGMPPNIPLPPGGCPVFIPAD